MSFHRKEEKSLISTLANLIVEKYQLENVETRSYTGNPDIFAIVMDDNAILPGGEKQNARATQLLRAVGAKVSSETGHVDYLTNTICTLTSSQCTAAIVQLNKLKTPEAKQQPQIIKAC